GLENVTGAIGVVRPDAGEAVGLQLTPDRDRRRAPPSARVARAREPEQLLNVVAHLVRDDVRLREVAGSAEAVTQLAEEIEVEIDTLVRRAIERADGGTRHA